LAYEVVYCSDCMKPIKSVPAWLSDVRVRFTCEGCRQKHPKAVAGYDTISAGRAVKDDDVIEDVDLLVVATDDEASEDADSDADTDVLIEPDVAFDEAPEEP